MQLSYGMSSHNVLSTTRCPDRRCLSMTKQRCASVLCLILFRHPPLLGQASSQAEPVVVLTVCFTEILRIFSSCEQTFLLPASGFISLIIVVPGGN